MAAAKAAGISEKTLRRARLGLRVESVKQGYGLQARWLWRLPETKAA